MVSKILSSRNEQTLDEPRGLDILSKIGGSGIESIGKITVKKNVAKISWKIAEVGKKNKKKSSKEAKEDEDDDDEDEDDDEEDEDVPDKVKKIIAKSKNEETTKTGCLSSLLEAKLTKDQEGTVTHVVVSEMDDAEWWTMVSSNIYSCILYVHRIRNDVVYSRI